MADRGQQRRANLVGLDRGLRLGGLAGEPVAVERDRDLRTERGEYPLVGGG
jgi:hypothetical protein